MKLTERKKIILEIVLKWMKQEAKLKEKMEFK